MRTERWTLALPASIASGVVAMWLDRDMPCDIRMRRAKEVGVCCLVVDIAPTEYEAVSMLSDIIRVTGCRVHKKEL